MTEFTLYPALDLRRGADGASRVVRLVEGDPQRQTVYSLDPAETARRWLQAGARWLHVVNLDAAFQGGAAGHSPALAGILKAAAEFGAQVQYGGGLRSLAAIETVLAAGVSRVVLGTAAVELPELLDEALRRWGNERVAAGLDARDGLVRVRGWQSNTGLPALELALELRRRGLEWLVFTDISRDGQQSGLNLAATAVLQQSSGLRVIASGGLKALDELHQARRAGLAGAILGRALYEGSLRLEDWYGVKPC